MKSSLQSLILLAFINALNSLGLTAASAQSPDQVPEVAAFQNWTPLVKNLKVESWMLALCSHVPSDSDQRFLSHTNSSNGSVSMIEKHVSVYANEMAFTHIKSGNKGEFPAGSIIVKEKVREEKRHSMNSLGVLIKRSKNFDPDFNDWEILYIEPTKSVARGRKQLQNCYECHKHGSFQNQIAIDYVFVSAYQH